MNFSVVINRVGTTPELEVLLGIYDVWEVRLNSADGTLIGRVHCHHPFPIFYPQNKKIGVDFITMKAIMDEWERLGVEWNYGI